MKKTGIKFDTRISMLVIFTTAFAMMMLGLGLIIFFVIFFSTQNNKNIQYVLTNTSREFSENIRFIEDGVISIRHNSILGEFLSPSGATSRIKDDEAETHLAYSLDLFSERNRKTSGEPFVVRTYLNNSNGRHISVRYYPETFQTMDAVDERYRQIIDSFNEEHFLYNFYEGTRPDTQILLTRLYDDNMKEVGICGVEFSTRALSDIFEAVSEYRGAEWYVGYYPSKETVPKPLISNTDGTEPLVSDTNSGEKRINQSSTYSFGLFSVMYVSRSNIFYNFGGAALIFFILCLVVLILMAGRIVNLIRQVYDKELLATRTQVKYLQAQLNPHFQYNILAMLGIKAKTGGNEELYESLRAFSKLVRGKIFEEKSIYIKLSEEMELVEFYLKLQKDRFGERLSYDIDYDLSLGNCLIPKLIVEPLVENSVEHGLEPKEGPGMVSINITEEEDRLFIRVEDDGVGLKDDKDKRNSHTGTSLTNTRQLLEVLYPGRHEISLERTIKETTLVSIRIPKKYD